MLSVKVFDNQSNKNDQNRLYTFYLSQWVPRFEKMNLDRGNLADTFQNFDQRFGLFTKGQPVGFFGSRQFDLSLTHQRQQNYLNQFDADLVDLIEENSFSLFRSIEFLCIHPLYRQRNNKNYAKILINFSIQYQIRQPIDGMIAVASIEYGVSQFCQNIGAEPLLRNVPYGPESVDILIFKPGKIVQPNDLPVVKETNSLLSQLMPRPNKALKVA